MPMYIRAVDPPVLSYLKYVDPALEYSCDVPQAPE